MVFAHLGGPGRNRTGLRMLNPGIATVQQLDAAKQNPTMQKAPVIANEGFAFRRPGAESGLRMSYPEVKFVLAKL